MTQDKQNSPATVNKTDSKNSQNKPNYFVIIMDIKWRTQLRCAKLFHGHCAYLHDFHQIVKVESGNYK